MASPHQTSPSSSDTARPPPKQFVYHDTPCLNCGRYGCIPGQMISDSFNNTFCSRDCGWSYHLRPYQQETARAAAAAAMRTGAAPRQRQKSRRSRSSKSASSSKSSSTTPNSSDAKQARPPKPVSLKRPPKLPNRPLSAAEKAAQVCLDSGHAMFDFNAGSDWWQ